MTADDVLSRPRSDSIASVSDDGERRLLARERNKEHARKTRLRKKEQLQSLKSRVSELEEEGRRLKQQIEACSVASILVGLSHGSSTGQEDDISGAASSSSSSQTKNYGETLSGGKRKRFLSLDGEEPSPPPMELNVKGHITLVGGPAGEGKTQINWKTGVYYDDQGKRHQLTKKELEELRRERNRMHAKMTRDRKKCYIASIKRVITKLEDQNQHLRDTLEKSQALSAIDNQSEDSPVETSVSSGHKNLEASATALGALNFATQEERQGSSSSSSDSGLDKDGSSTPLSSDAREFSSVYNPSSKMGLSHILPSGSVVVQAHPFSSNVYTVG